VPSTSAAARRIPSTSVIASGAPCCGWGEGEGEA
jgi:hypothetical protein